MKSYNKIFILAVIAITLINPIYAIVKKGGELKIRMSQYPRSLNYFTGGDAYSGMLSSLTQESMITQKDEDYSNIPLLAKSWKISDDKFVYTFYIDKNARFSDGKKVTAYDVKFTYDTIYDKKCILCQSVRDFVGPLEYIKVKDAYTIEFKTKKIHFQNLNRLGGMPILPKHIYGANGKDFNKDFEKTLKGSGPYIYQPDKSKKSVTLIRNKNWWGIKSLPYYKDYYNFDKILIKIIKDDNVALEVFKKKQIDILYIEKSIYNKWDKKKLYPWTNKNCVRLTMPKTYPVVWGGIALNMRKSPTNEKKFRKALQLILNRPLIINKVYKNKEKSVIGPFMEGTVYSAGLPAIPYDPKKASKLLTEIGYTKVGDDGILYKEITKNGKKMKQRASLQLMHSTESHNQWATIYKEDAKKVGIEINIRLVEWTSATKLLDEFKFDSFVIGWVGSPVPAPEQLLFVQGYNFFLSHLL